MRFLNYNITLLFIQILKQHRELNLRTIKYNHIFNSTYVSNYLIQRGNIDFHYITPTGTSTPICLYFSKSSDGNIRFCFDDLNKHCIRTVQTNVSFAASLPIFKLKRATISLH